MKGRQVTCVCVSQGRAQSVPRLAGLDSARARRGRGNDSMRSVWGFLIHLKDERKLRQAGSL